MLNRTITYCFRWRAVDILMKSGQKLWFKFISHLEKQHVQNTETYISFFCSVWNVLFWEQWGYCSNFENLEIRKRILKLFAIKSYGRENPTEQYLNPKVIRKLVFLGRKKFTILFSAKCFVLDITIIYCFRWTVGDILMKCGQELWFMFISDIEKQNIQNTDKRRSFFCSLWNALFWEQWGYC